MAASDSAEHKHVLRDYETEQIVVHWDSARCVHSANCLNGLPEVFDVRRRPWIRMDGGTADQIAATVDTCPSRALTYTRLDDAPSGVNGTDAQRPAEGPDRSEPETAAEVVISLKPDGPLMVEGPTRIELARGEVIQITDRAVLCRCGGSGSKPFCDGSHKRNGFQAEGW